MLNTENIGTNTTAFCDIEPCSVVEVDGLHHQSALMMEAVRTSETSVYFNGLRDAVSQKAVIFIPPP
jgi:very-short-patch-repair endonuclease